jgi:hypothetical protein
LNSVKEKIINALSGIKRSGMDMLVAYLSESDFFTAPASTKYHSSYEGGLAEHSWNVFTCLVEKNRTYNLGLGPDTLAITALLHDVCKVNFYKRGIKNVKEGKKTNWKGQEVDNWVEKEVWEVEDQLPLGHGEKSVIILQQYIQLTPVEIAMIRWHMGGYGSNDNMALQNAQNMWPEVTAMHTADLEATYILENEVKNETTTLRGQEI